MFFFFFFNITKYHFSPGGDSASFKKKKKPETHSFASSVLLFQYSSLLVPLPHIIKHIIIT